MDTTIVLLRIVNHTGMCIFAERVTNVVSD
jgi:hypothetical protein